MIVEITEVGGGCGCLGWFIILILLQELMQHPLLFTIFLAFLSFLIERQCQDHLKVHLK